MLKQGGFSKLSLKMKMISAMPLGKLDTGKCMNKNSFQMKVDEMKVPKSKGRLNDSSEIKCCKWLSISYLPLIRPRCIASLLHRCALSGLLVMKAPV